MKKEQQQQRGWGRERRSVRAELVSKNPGEREAYGT